METIKPLVAIVGPTAVGKTDISIEVAKVLGCEIISADSMLVYRGMDIGTAKPTVEEMQGIPHHMIDVVNPDQEYSVATYQKCAEQLVEEIILRGKLPLLVGGTGLYVKSVIDHYDFGDSSKNELLRNELVEEAKKVGPERMHYRLQQVDPESAGRLHPNDLRRVIRALEVFYQTGKSISNLQYSNSIKKPKYHLQMFGLTMDRQLLYQRIELRVEKMMQAGLVEEVAELRKLYGSMGTAMQGLGYKEIVSYLEGKFTLLETIELIKKNTRRFAKRQLTWFKADKRIQWIELDKYPDRQNVSLEIAKQIAGEFSIV